MIVNIEKLVPGGDGMGRVEGKVVFVPLTVPGEVHRVNIIEEKKGFSRGESVELLEKAKDSETYHRIEPFCPHYGKCGGCNLQHLSYEEQLTAKIDMARSGFVRTGGLSEDLPLEIVPSPEKGYRNRVQLHFERGAFGFRERNGNDIVPLDSCPLLVKGINQFLADFKRHTSVGPDLIPERLTLFGTDEKYWVEGKDKRIDLLFQEKSISFAPDLFFQSNLALVSPLLKDVTDFAGTGDWFLDLYSGVGLFSLFLEDNFKRGIAVESAKGSTHHGKMNLKKTQYIEKKVEQWAKKWINKDEKIDFAVVDPPRVGLSSQAIDALVSLKPKKLAYVSCNPVTQARDIKTLLTRGYELQSIKLYDFYPQTAHLESLATLTYKGL